MSKKRGAKVRPPPPAPPETPAPPEPAPPTLRPPVSPDSRAMWISAALVVVTAVVLLRFARTLTPFLVAYLLAYLLHPTILKLEGRIKRLWGSSDPRLHAVVAFYLIGGSALMAVGIPLVIALASNALQLADFFTLPDIASAKLAALRLYDKYHAWIAMVPHSDELLQALHGHQDQVIATTGTFLQKLGQHAGEVVRRVAGAVLSGGAGALSLAIVPVALFYMLYDFESINRVGLELVPRSHQAWTRKLLARVDVVLGGFVRGQLTIICIAMCVFTVGLWLLGVRYALLIGPMAGMVTFVPYLGLFGLLPAAVVSVIQGGLTTVTLMRLGGLVGLALVWNALEGLVLQPRLIGQAVALHPLLVLIALGLGGEVAGLQGLMLAVPTAALIKVLFEESRDIVYADERFTGQD